MHLKCNHHKLRTAKAFAHELCMCNRHTSEPLVLMVHVSGQSKQASKQANIHTNRHNEVMLVWGSLRLAPIMPFNIDVSVMTCDYHHLRGRAFIKELHHRHVGCSCNDCNGSTICVYHEQKIPV